MAEVRLWNGRIFQLLTLLAVWVLFAVRLDGQEPPRYLPPPEALRSEPRAFVLPPVSEAEYEAQRRAGTAHPACPPCFIHPVCPPCSPHVECLPWIICPADCDTEKSKTDDDILGLQEFWKKLISPARGFMKHHNLCFTGRVHADGAFFGASQETQRGTGGVGNLVNTANVRRARIALCGNPYDNINWVSELGFEAAFDGVIPYPGLVNVFVEATELPWVGNFRIGHFKEPFSLEALSSSNSIPFMERSSPFDAFVPFRNLGAMVFDTALDNRMTWATGIFRTNSQNTRTPLNKGDGEYASTSRITFLPWYADDGKNWLHLGGAFSYRGFFGGSRQEGRFRAYPGIRTGRHIFNDTGVFLSDNTNVSGVEVALNWGSLNLQGEYYHVWVRDALIENQLFHPQFHGWYVQASYFLTGEHRIYQQGPGAVLRPCPNQDCFFLRKNGFRNGLGLGAWEVAARYSRLDVNDSAQGIDGQVLQTVTLGLNWYVNPNARVMWNYVLAGRDFPSFSNRGIVHIFAMRMQVDF